MDPIKEFKEQKTVAIEEMSKDAKFKEDSLEWIFQAAKHKYMYNYSWLGRPIIKFPTDILLLQELYAQFHVL